MSMSNLGGSTMSHHNPFNNLLTLLFVTLIRQYQGHSNPISKKKEKRTHSNFVIFSDKSQYIRQELHNIDRYRPPNMLEVP